MKNKHCIILLSAVLLLSSCSFAPKFAKPKMDIPSTYDNKTAQNQSVGINWWKNFNDRELNCLIKEALKNNDNLRLAVIRVNEARAYLGLTGANLYPSVNALESGYRQKTSSEMPPKGYGTIANNFSLSSSVGYELDFWGKLKNQKKAALSSLLANRFDKETVKLMLIADTANTYFNLIAIDEELKTAQRSVESFKNTYEYRTKQYKYGSINELTVAQAKAQYANAKVLVESLKEQKIMTTSALAVLLGKSPKAIFENKTKVGSMLPKPIKIPCGLPSNLLENRPDIRAAEENLKAKNALIGVAKAEYFPSISLTGILGFQSADLNNLMQRSARIWGVGVSSAMPVFEFGRIKSNVKIAEAEKRAALIRYKQTVRKAFKEVFDALNKLRLSKRKLKAQVEEYKALKRALYLSKKRYDSGYSDYLEVLDAQRGFLGARLNLIKIKNEITSNEITLYKALGGGWKEGYSKDEKYEN